ncbi:hypothetical protein ACTFIT_003905 [Dictyostelium discoideum]
MWKIFFLKQVQTVKTLKTVDKGTTTWHKRNKLIHDEKEIIIHRQQVILELIKTQRAAWDRTQAVINKTLRIKSKQRPEEQNKLDSLISLKLLQFNRQWNSPLHAIELPKHLKKYNNSLSIFYK